MMKKRWIFLPAFLVVAMGAFDGVLNVQHAQASTSASGTVNYLVVQPFGGTNNQGLLFFKTTASMNNPHSCLDGQKRYVADLGTEGGRTIQSLVLAARLSGRPIAVNGTGSIPGTLNPCNLWPGSESIWYVDAAP